MNWQTNLSLVFLDFSAIGAATLALIWQV